MVHRKQKIVVISAEGHENLFQLDFRRAQTLEQSPE